MEKLQTKERDYLFDNLKGVLIFLVVFAHIVGKMYSFDKLSNIIFTSVYVFHMPMFIFISGYFSKKFKLHKVIDLFIVYSLWQLLIYPVSMYILTNNSTGLLSSKLQYPQYTYWYLLSLIAWKIVTAIIPKSKLILIVVTIISYIPCLVRDFNFTTFSLGRIITFYPFFYAGYIISKDEFSRLHEGKSKKGAIIKLLIVFIAIYVLFISQNIKADFLYFRESSYDFVSSVKDIIILRSISLILATLCIIYIPRLVSNKETMLSNWGQNSFIIYLTHSFIVKSFRFSVGKMSSLSFVILAFIFSYGFCILMSTNLVKKYIGPLTNISIKNLKVHSFKSEK